MGGWHKERMKYEGFGRSILKEQVEVHMCGFDGIQRGNYSGENLLEELRLR